MDKLIFKKYPSCGGTQSSTELILDLMRDESLEADDVEHIEIRIVPYLYRLVGHPFELGSNPKVNAQFSVRYCVANALLRKASTLAHFEVEAIGDPDVLRMVERIDVDPGRRPGRARPHRGGPAGGRPRAEGSTSERRTSPRDSAGNPLTKAEHVQRFWDCLAFGDRPDGRTRRRGTQIVAW